MPQTPPNPKNSLSPDWFVHGVLTKLGDMFDRLLGRGWKPASSLATSELIERLKTLLDAEARETPTKAKFVPHNITLKMQWDKFSTDAESALKTLENELLTAAVDHINDRRYYTYAPITIEAKPDYFTSGVKLHAGFEKFVEEGREGEVNVTIPGMRIDGELLSDAAQPESINALAKFTLAGRSVVKKLHMAVGRRISVGRTKENDLTIEDASVSKIHASLVLNSEKTLVVADTGSTNGTFINDARIPYGKALELAPGDRLIFGSIEVTFELIAPSEPAANDAEEVGSDSYTVGEFEFTRRVAKDGPDRTPPPETIPAIASQPEIMRPEITSVEPEHEETK